MEADESDRSLLAVEAQIAVLLNVELDHGDVFASLGELRELFTVFAQAAPQAVLAAHAGLEPIRADAALADPGTVELRGGRLALRVARPSASRCAFPEPTTRSTR